MKTANVPIIVTDINVPRWYFSLHLISLYALISHPRDLRRGAVNPVEEGIVVGMAYY